MTSARSIAQASVCSKHQADASSPSLSGAILVVVSPKVLLLEQQLEPSNCFPLSANLPRRISMCPSHVVVALVLPGLVRAACGIALLDACNCRSHLPGVQQLHRIDGLVSAPEQLLCRWYHAKSGKQPKCLEYSCIFTGWRNGHQ